MTMFVDPREGSKLLIEPMTAAGIPVEVSTLPFGDVAFWGRGEKGKPVYVGVEYKKLGDYLSSMKGRLQGHQLPGMVKGFDRRYLIVEGEFEHDSRGRLLRRAGRSFWKPMLGAPPAAEVIKRMLVMELRGGISTYVTTSLRQTSLLLACLYRVWCDVDMDSHKSHLAIYTPDLDKRLSEDVSLKRTIAAQLPGIGYERSKVVDLHFSTVQEMVNASEKEWQKIEGIGRKLAQEIVTCVQKLS